MFEGAALPNVGLNAVAGRVPEEYGVDPLAFSEMRPGCYDIHERIRDMDVNGVLGSLNFPSIAGFAGQLFSTCDDKDIALELLQAYNDWHVDDWCGAYPGRMIPLSIPPLWDPQLMAAEVRRMAGKGCHAVTFSENPEKLGHPSWHSDHWDPFLAACEETGTVICLHIGSSSQAVDHRDGRADRHDDHAPADEHRAVRRRPGVVAGVPQVPRPAGRAERGRHRLGAVLPRADRLRLPAPQGVDEPGLRRQAARARSSTSTSSPASSTTRSAWRCATTSTPTTSTGSATTPTPTRPGPTPPRWR